MKRKLFVLCYQTNDLMNDESYILENDKNILLIEFPAFYDNLEEFETYVKGLNKNIVGKVFSDHPNGGTILKDVKGYASEGTIKSMKDCIYTHMLGYDCHSIVAGEGHANAIIA